MPTTRFRQWRRSRPFWGGLWVVAGGAVILLVPLAPLPLLLHQGVAGISGYLAGLLLVVAGLLSWWQPGQRVFLGVTAIALSLGSFVTSNLGGLGLGMLAGLTGGALLCAWTPTAARPTRRKPAAGRGGEPLRAVVLVPMALALALPVTQSGTQSDAQSGVLLGASADVLTRAAESGRSRLTAARLTLWGGRIDGVVRRPAGDRLRLSMSAIEITDGLHRMRGSGAVVDQRFSRLRMSGGVVMYVTRLRARVGGVGLTLTPALPLPALPLPSMTVTDIEADRLLIRAGHTHVSGLTQRAHD